MVAITSQREVVNTRRKSSAHVHFEQVLEPARLQQTHGLQTGAGHDANLGVLPSGTHQERGSTTSPVAADLRLATIGIEQSNRPVVRIVAFGHHEPAVGANTGVPVTNGFRDLGKPVS
jgi:hypothetical protein